jgi:ribosomal subunit interface protein
MRIETRQTNVPFSDALRAFVEQRVGAALKRYRDHRLGRVRVWIEDENGPRHGDEDKVCRIVLEMEPHVLDGGGQIVAEGSSHDAYAAVTKAAHRLHGTVRRRIERQHNVRRPREARALP